MKVTSKRLFTEELGRINMTFSAVAYAELDSSWSMKKMKAPFTRIYLVDGGKARVMYNGETIDLVPGNAYILPAGLDFSCECEEFMSKVFFHVNILRYDKYDIFNECHKCIVLKDKIALTEKMKGLLNKDTINSVLTIKSEVLALVTQAIEQENINLGAIKEYSQLVKKVLKMIEAELTASLKVPELAEKLYISESRLQKTFKEEVGVSIGKYIDDRLMVKAEAMIREKHYSVKEISEILGFCDQFYFSRRFAQRFGVSPASYKKKIYL